MRSLTFAELAAIVAEVDGLATGSGVQKVYARDEHSFVLRLRGGGATRYLLVDTRPGWTRLHFVEGKPAQPDNPPAFVMLLRKHLVGAGLRGVELAQDDRRVTLALVRRDEEGEREYQLVAELFGRRGNALLLRAGVVLGVLDPRAPGAQRPGETYAAGAGPGAEQLGGDELGLGALAIGERSAAVAALVDAQAEVSSGERRRAEVEVLLGREVRRLGRLVKNLEQDLARAESAQQARRYGELLQSAYRLDVPRGATAVRVPDYWAEGAPEVEVAIDPARSLQENIARYFHEYRRMKDAAGTISERLLGAMEQLEELLGTRARLGELDDADLASLAERLSSAGAGRRRAVASRGRRGQEPTPPYRAFVARSGAPILVGRSARHNDALTTKVARGRDVWMHARDWAGSHVVLRMDRDGEPNGEDLRDAALLAAHFSKGRGDTLVDVTYTRAKHVRKPRGAPPGLVTIAGGATLAVGPDPDRLAALFATEVVDG